MTGYSSQTFQRAQQQSAAVASSSIQVEVVTAGLVMEKGTSQGEPLQIGQKPESSDKSRDSRIAPQAAC